MPYYSPYAGVPAERDLTNLVWSDYDKGMEVNIYDAKTKLSQLVERAVAGEEVIIAKAGKPMVKLVRVDAPSKREFGTAAGSIVCHEGWDAPMSDQELSEFLGG